MPINFDDYERAFEAAQTVFDDGIDMTDYSQNVMMPSDARETFDFLTERQPDARGFYPLEITKKALETYPQYYLGRVLLMRHKLPGTLVPVVFLPTRDRPVYVRTRVDRPFDAQVGLSSDMHWATSLAPQTRQAEFESHGSPPSGLRQSHFGAAILGAANSVIAHDIEAGGDTITHRLLQAGIADVMDENHMLPFPLTTTHLSGADRGQKAYRMKAFWHETMQNDNGPMGADFPEATRLMLGAGLHAVGEEALPSLERLVEDVVRGARVG